MRDECGHVIAALLCKTCVERDFEAQKELTGFYVEKLNKAEAEIERLRAALGGAMIEIPAEYIEAWRIFMEFNVRDSGLADAFVWAIAELRRSEFEREHRMEIDFSNDRMSSLRYDYCCRCGNIRQKRADPRHTWTDAQWQQAVRGELEGKP